MNFKEHNDALITLNMSDRVTVVAEGTQSYSISTDSPNQPNRTNIWLIS